MVAGRGGVKKDGRKPSALEELFGCASDSEASTFHGFEDAELEDILLSDHDDDDDAVADSGTSWLAGPHDSKNHRLSKRFHWAENWTTVAPLEGTSTRKIWRFILKLLI